MYVRGYLQGSENGRVATIAFKYEIPSPVEFFFFLDNPPNRNAWKRTTQTTINQYWKDKLIKDAESYITLRYLGKKQATSLGKPQNLLDILV